MNGPVFKTMDETTQDVPQESIAKSRDRLSWCLPIDWNEPSIDWQYKLQEIDSLNLFIEIHG